MALISARRDELRLGLRNCPPGEGFIELNETAGRRLGKRQPRLGRRQMGSKRTQGNAKGSAGHDAETGSGLQYVHYLKARELLRTRLDATPHEIAMWVWLGSQDGGLDAYIQGDDEGAWKRFYFPDYEPDADFLAMLMGCYFRLGDLNQYIAKDRYIAFPALMERWTKYLSESEARSLILSKGAKGELEGFHPLSGGVQEAGLWQDQEGFPPLEDGIFWLAQVEAIEEEVFPDHEHKFPSDAESRKTQAFATAQSERDCRLWLAGLMRKGDPEGPKSHYMALAKTRFKMSDRAFLRAWSSALTETANTAWNKPGRKSKRRIDTPG